MKGCIAVGMTVILDTASDPAREYKFSVDEQPGRNNVDQIVIDLNYLKTAEDRESWFFMDPQFVIDNRTDYEFAVICRSREAATKCQTTRHLSSPWRNAAIFAVSSSIAACRAVRVPHAMCGVTMRLSPV